MNRVVRVRTYYIENNIAKPEENYIRYLDSKLFLKAEKKRYKTYQTNLDTWEVTLTTGKIIVDEDNFMSDIVYYTFSKDLYKQCYDVDKKVHIPGRYDVLYHLEKYGDFF